MSFKDAWDRAGEEQDDFDPADGSYNVTIVDAGAFSAKSDGREWCKVTLRINGTDAAGRSFDDFGPAGDHNPVGLRIMREKLVVYGLDPDNIQTLDDLDGAMKRDLIGRTADITVRHKDGYRNVNVSGSRTGSGQPSLPASATGVPNGSSGSFAAAAAQATAEDDIPF
jgi:hypothetical protein